jgi:Cu/Ag efflux protein CusF
MHKLALAIALVAALGSTSVMAATTTTTASTAMATKTTTMKPAAKPAPAPLTATGKVAAVDAKACTVTIDKTAYHFGAKCKISGLKVGENVTVTYKKSGKLDWITKIVVAKA